SASTLSTLSTLFCTIVYWWKVTYQRTRELIEYSTKLPRQGRQGRQAGHKRKQLTNDVHLITKAEHRMPLPHRSVLETILRFVRKRGRGLRPVVPLKDSTFCLAHQTGDYKQRDEAKEQGERCYRQHCPYSVLYVV